MDKCELCNTLEGSNSISVGDPKSPVVLLVCWKCSGKLVRDMWCAEKAVRKILETPLADRTEGTVNFACMVESGQGPQINTDATFFHGWQNSGGRQFEGDTPMARMEYMEAAKRDGISTQGKVYQHGLARFPGDPEAWVGTRGEMKAVLEKRGWGCERLGVAARAATEAPVRVGELADDIVARHVERNLADVPEAGRTPQMIADAKEAARRDHGAKPAHEPKRKPKAPSGRKLKGTR